MPRWTGAADTKHRSVSQLNSYDRCPYAYYLSRIAEPAVPRRPAAWLPMGTSLHEAIEAVEKEGLTLDQAVGVYEESFITAVNDLTDSGWNWEQWFASGRYHGAEDTERRFKLGREHLERYFEYRDTHEGDVIWISPDGTPGIELEFDVDLDGVRVLGMIDQILLTRTDEETSRDILHVRDVKTGSSPSDDLQLGVYKVALLEMFDNIEVPSGDYFLSKTGSATFPYDLSEYTYDYVASMFRELEDNITAGRFDPRPDSSVCRRCDVAHACEYAV